MSNRIRQLGDRAYMLRCLACSASYPDDGLMLDCPVAHEPSLLRTEYRERTFPPAGGDGLFRYSAWLPVVRHEAHVASSVTYRADSLSSVLDLGELWVLFSGYWPERGGLLQTCTFKELEAFTVLGRLPDPSPVIVVASAGNTAAGFLYACSRWRVPLLLVVPETALPNLALPSQSPAFIRLVIVGGDYTDAMDIADVVAAQPGFYGTGGTRNVARRDGLGVAFLAAAEAIGRLPDYYVQAVGSGAGAIAAYEAARRLLSVGFSPALAGTDEGMPRLVLCQNLPFAPMFDAWRAGQSSISIGDGPAERARIARTLAPELATRRPSYAICGGVRDALIGSHGTMLAADNTEIRAAQETFRAAEGIDIEPPSGTALACLRRAVATNRVRRSSTVLLHVTGGGRLRYRAEHQVLPLQPDLRLVAQMSAASIIEATARIVGETPSA